MFALHNYRPVEEGQRCVLANGVFSLRDSTVVERSTKALIWENVMEKSALVYNRGEVFKDRTLIEVLKMFKIHGSSAFTCGSIYINPTLIPNSTPVILA